MQGFYAVAFKAASMDIAAGVWEQFRSEQDKGSKGLYDPRWHPKVLSRAKACNLNQLHIDYFVSFLLSQHFWYKQWIQLPHALWQSSIVYLLCADVCRPSLCNLTESSAESKRESQEGV